MRRLIPVLLILLFLAPLTVQAARANEFRFWLEQSRGEHYQQTEYTPVDPKGDAFLIRKLDQVPMKLVRALIGQDDYHSADSSYGNGTLEIIQREIDAEDEPGMFARLFGDKDYEVGRSRPVNVDRLLNAYRGVFLEFPEFFLHPGGEMGWSPEARRYMRTGFWHRLGEFLEGRRADIPAPLLFRSKLFLCLACGYTSRYMISGMEETLRQRLLSYPDRSIQLLDAFRESYRLHRGDLFLTMLCLENVLAGNPYVEDRSSLPLQKKLVYLRNDFPEKGDNYGAWYHFHGIALYGMVRSGLVARAVAEIESLGSIFLEGFDHQEDLINRHGARFGVRLRRLLDSGTAWEPLDPFARTDYMTQQEFQGGADLSDEEYARLRVETAPAADRPALAESFAHWQALRRKTQSWLRFWPGYGQPQKKAYAASWIAAAAARDARELEKAPIPPEAREKLRHLNRDRWEKFRQHKLGEGPGDSAERAARAWLAQRVEEFARKYHRERQKALEEGDYARITALDASVGEFQAGLVAEATRPDKRPWWRRVLDFQGRNFRNALGRLAPAYGQILTMATGVSNRPGPAPVRDKVSGGPLPVDQVSPSAASTTPAASPTHRPDLPVPTNLDDARQKMEAAYAAWVKSLTQARPDEALVRNNLEIWQHYRNCYEELQAAAVR